MANLCDDVDAYLAGELSIAAAERFTAHIRDCEMCRDTVDQQRWIDGLLRSPERELLETPPAGLLASLNSPVTAAAAAGSRVRRPLVATSLAAAAALVVVGAAALWNRQPADKPPGTQASIATAGPATEEPATAEPEDVPPLETPRPPRATLVGGPDLIVVPVESRHPNVSIFRVYPTFEPAYAAKTGASPSSSFDAASPDYTNGG